MLEFFKRVRSIRPLRRIALPPIVDRRWLHAPTDDEVIRAIRSVPRHNAISVVQSQTASSSHTQLLVSNAFGAAVTTGNTVIVPIASFGTNAIDRVIDNLNNTTCVTNGATLPVSSLVVNSTAGFPSSGTLNVQVNAIGAPLTQISYTGTSGGNTFTGCTGGSGTTATGLLVWNSPNTWTVDKTYASTSDTSNRINLVRASNVTGGFTKIAVNFVTGAVFQSYGAIEVSGLATSSPSDGTGATASGSSTAPATGNFTTNNAVDILIAITVNDSGSTVTYTEPSGFTSFAQITSGAVTSFDAAYRILASAGTFNPTWTIAPTAAWAALVWAYKAAAAAGGESILDPTIIGSSVIGSSVILGGNEVWD